MYEDCKVGNPITSKDGRVRIYIKFPDGRQTVMSYPKYLMECFLNRKLDINETVDHIDCNPLNNDLSNLRILDRKEHAKIDVKRLKSQTVKCVFCGKEIELTPGQINDRRGCERKGKSGPFCSKSCSGKYGAMIQNNQIEKIDSDKIVMEYYTLKEKEDLQ